jgi:hypothetical protein
MATVFEPIRPVPPITTNFMVDPPHFADGNLGYAPCSGISNATPN